MGSGRAEQGQEGELHGGRHCGIGKGVYAAEKGEAKSCCWSAVECGRPGLLRRVKKRVGVWIDKEWTERELVGKDSNSTGERDRRWQREWGHGVGYIDIGERGGRLGGWAGRGGRAGRAGREPVSGVGPWARKFWEAGSWGAVGRQGRGCRP